MSVMKVLSVFTGIGLHDLGLTWAGMEIAGQIENDEYCTQILEARFPDVVRWRDIRDVEVEDVQRRCGHIDIITGGFPCQDVSVAGIGKGLEEGTRSGLWSEMYRLIAGIQPSWVLVENVPALRGRGADRVLAELGAAGYTCWPCVVGAGHFAAPHRRQRVWIVGYAHRGMRSPRIPRWGSESGIAAGGASETIGLSALGDSTSQRFPEIRGDIDADAGFVPGGASGGMADTQSGRQRSRKRVAGNQGSSGSISDTQRFGELADTSNGGCEGNTPTTSQEKRSSESIGNPGFVSGGSGGSCLTPCQFCGYEFDHELLGKYGCPNCEGRPVVGGEHAERERCPERHAADFADLTRLRGWPAPPGPQHEWEAPRIAYSTSGKGLAQPEVGSPTYGRSRRMVGSERRAALKALGNANPPQVVEALGRAIIKLQGEME